jgi:hypothetical protein
VNPSDAPQPPLLPEASPAHRAPGLRSMWHAIGVLLAATIAWLVFAAYRQPELLLDVGGMRLCVTVAAVVG